MNVEEHINDLKGIIEQVDVIKKQQKEDFGKVVQNMEKNQTQINKKDLKIDVKSLNDEDNIDVNIHERKFEND